MDVSVEPPVELSTGVLGEVQEADRQIARWTARRARAVARFAASRPASADRQQGEPGAMSPGRWAARPEVLRPVSEWAAPELVVALSRSRTDVERLLERSLLLERLPGVLAALEAGALTDAHLWPVLDLLAPVASHEVRAAVEEEVLRWLAARSADRRITTPPQLREKLRREVLRRGAREAAQRALTAVRERGVHRQAESGEGMAAVAAVLTEPEAQALLLALGAYADAVEDEPGAGARTRSQKMADCLLDLVLRPGESGHPPVQVALTLVAGVQTLLGGDGPAELGGRTVSAETARQLLRALAGVGADGPPPPAPPGADAPPPAERVLLELADWWDDVECRVLAGELEPGPQPLPDLLVAAWGEDLLDSLLDDPPGEEDLADLQALLLPGEQLDVTDVGAGGPGGSPPGGTGWWASADRAVEDAAAALHDARLALGSAVRLVRTAARADLDDERAWRESAAGRVDAAEGALDALHAAADDDRALLAELLERTAGGGLADRPRIALADELSGALVALTDLPGLRRAARCGRPRCRRRPGSCEHDLGDRPGLGAPGRTAGYRPGAELDRFVRARDRRCRFPGCRRPVATGELDHRVRYPDGPTDVFNLAGLCTGDHRGKHQAPGWAFEVGADGSLVVTTPTGLQAATGPPPF